VIPSISLIEKTASGKGTNRTVLLNAKVDFISNRILGKSRT